MENNLSYKKCNLDEVEMLTEISRKTFVDAFEQQNNPQDFKTYIDSAFNLIQISEELKNSNSEIYFVYMDETLVGYFKINQNKAQTEMFGDESIELSRIYMLSEFQGHHLGSLCLQKIIALA